MRYRRGLAALAVFALVLAACSSGAEDTTTTRPTMPPSSTVATTSSTSSTTSSTTSTTSPYGGATLLTSVIQMELTVLGYFEGNPDGILGPKTEEAIAAFQKDAGITADGQYGPETYLALADALEADTDFVTDVQEDLMELKLYAGPADGDYGSGTIKAVEALQEQCKMDVDGRFTPKTHICLEEQMGRA
jgi:peptidoglycan hydrolase-like protein with peptidoglycan-binding domain